MTTETLRIEKVCGDLRAVLQLADVPVAIDDLRRILRKLKGPIREGDFRSALWQCIDGGAAKITTSRMVQRTAIT